MFSSPPGLVDLCFSVLRRVKVVDHVLDPLKVQKTNSSMNTDDDDDTISMMSFDDPVSFDDAVEEDMNLDNILQQQSFLDPVLPRYVSPIPTPLVGA